MDPCNVVCHVYRSKLCGQKQTSNLNENFGILQALISCILYLRAQMLSNLSLFFILPMDHNRVLLSHEQLLSNQNI